MSSIVLPRRADGTLDLPGLHEHKVDYDFAWASTVPTDLVTSGTVAVTPGNSTGVLTLTTAATVSAQTYVYLPQLVDLTTVEAVTFTVSGLKMPAANSPQQLFLALASGTTGGAYWRYTQQQLLSRSGSPTNVSAPINLFTSGRAATTTIGLTILPKLKIAAFMNGDQEVQVAAMPDMILGAAQPQLTIQTNAAVAQSASVAKLSLAVRYS